MQNPEGDTGDQGEDSGTATATTRENSQLGLIVAHLDRLENRLQKVAEDQRQDRALFLVARPQERVLHLREDNGHGNMSCVQGMFHQKRTGLPNI